MLQPTKNITRFWHLTQFPVESYHNVRGFHFTLPLFQRQMCLYTIDVSSVQQFIDIDAKGVVFYNITAINFFSIFGQLTRYQYMQKNLISSGKFQSFRRLLNDIFMYHSLARPYICICFYHYNSCVLNNGWYCDLIYS